MSKIKPTSFEYDLKYQQRQLEKYQNRANNHCKDRIELAQRIVDQYAIWVILSRIGVTCSLFGLQDVTQGWIEKKHQEHFNPVVLHYTTKGEQELAKSDEKYNDLIRDVDSLGSDIDPYSVL